MSDIVQKLWGFCHTLRHDGIDYGDYIEQLTYFLFRKMADERGIDLSRTKFRTEKNRENRSGLLLADTRRKIGYGADRPLRRCIARARPAIRSPWRHFCRRPLPLSKPRQSQKTDRSYRRDRMDHARRGREGGRI